MGRYERAGNTRVRTCDAGLLEALEPRTLMASNFAFVGIGQGTGVATEFQWGEGTFNDNGSVTGTYTHASLVSGPQTSALPYDQAAFASGGRFTVTAAPGQPVLTSQTGSNPLATSGYPFGSLSIEYDTGAGPGRSDAFLIQKPATLASWGGLFTFSAVRLTASGREIVTGAFRFSDNSGQNPTQVTWQVDGQPEEIKPIASLSADGKAVLTTGEVIFLARPFEAFATTSVALVAELDNSDGDIMVGIGSGVPGFSYSDSAGVWGVYRGLAMTDGPLGQAFLGGTPEGSAPFVLDLAYNGTFKLYEAKAYDAGGRNAVTSGTWRVSQFSDVPTFPTDRLLLTDTATGRTLVMAVTPEQQWRFETIRYANGAVAETVMGAMRTLRALESERAPQNITVNLENGRPVVYQIYYTAPNSTSYTWNSIDLISRAGGKTLSKVEIVDLNQSNSEHLIAGIALDGDVLVWERDFRGQWLFRNLTQQFAAQGAAAITAEGVIFQGNSFQQRQSSSGQAPTLSIAGRQAGGDLVVYTVGSTADTYGTQEWTFVNVTQTQLAPYGVSTPVWDRSVIGYGTYWGGLNIAGLNSAGEIVVAWTAPGLTRWYVDNLSEIAGTPGLAGNLMAYVTSWNAIHLNGLTPDGHLVVTWWAPANVGQWYANDLTAEFGGPILPPQRPNDAENNLVFFNGAGGSLNVVAYDTLGNAVVYWWYPGGPGWLIGNLTSAVPLNQRPTELIRAESFRGYTDEGNLETRQNVYGHNDQGDLVRLYWEQGGPDVWLVQNITDIAVPLP